MDRTQTRWLVLGVGLAVLIAAAVWADWSLGWVEPAFDFVAHQFYEVPLLARIRRPSQLVLVRWHLTIWAAMGAFGLMLAALARAGTRGSHS